MTARPPSSSSCSWPPKLPERDGAARSAARLACAACVGLRGADLLVAEQASGRRSLHNGPFEITRASSFLHGDGRAVDERQSAGHVPGRSAVTRRSARRRCTGVRGLAGVRVDRSDAGTPCLRSRVDAAFAAVNTGAGRCGGGAALGPASDSGGIHPISFEPSAGRSGRSKITSTPVLKNLAILTTLVPFESVATSAPLAGNVFAFVHVLAR